MSFLIVIVIVAAVTILFALLAATGALRPLGRVRRGQTWIDHPDEVPVEQRPSEDEIDEPVPHLVPRARY
jgi:hypothetical protein